jgi:hypothetical protein
MYENGKSSLAIYLHHMGTVNGVLPTDINDAFNKITAFITLIFVATTGGGGATPEQLALKTDKGGYTGSTKDLENTFVAAVTGASGISIVPTSPAPSGTGIASFTATQAGTYTNYGGVVVNANSFAIISRSAAGVFSISQTALDLTSYAKSVDVNNNLLTKADLIVGKNVFDKSKVLSGFYLSNTNFQQADAQYSISDFIPVIVGQAYKSNLNMRFTCYFDANKVFVAGGNSALGNTFTVPSSVAFVKITIFSTDLNTFQLEKGTVSTVYESYVLKINPNNLSDYTNTIGLNTLLDSLLSKKLDLVPNKNIFNKDNVILNSYIQSNASGAIESSSLYDLSQFISVTPSTQYKASYNFRFVAFYTIDKTFISGGAAQTNTFTTPSNIAFVRVSIFHTNLDLFQLELGSTSTIYENYLLSADPTKLLDYVKNTVFKDSYLIGNLFNTASIVTGALVSSTLSLGISVSASWKITNAIAVIPNKVYTISGWNTARSEIAFFSGLVPTLTTQAYNTALISSGRAGDLGLVKANGVMTFTTPSNATWITFTIKNDSEADSVFSSLQIKKEASVSNYEAYSGKKAINTIDNNSLSAKFIETDTEVISAEKIASLFVSPLKTNEVSLIMATDTFSVRTNYSQTQDLIHTWVKNGTSTQFLQITSVYKINKTDYNGSGTLLHAISDNIAPFRMEDLAIGSGHSVICPTITTTHDKTSADLLSIWSLSNGQQFYLIGINGNTLQFYGKRYTIATGETIPLYLANSGVLTHYSGATNTANITMANSDIPMVQSSEKNRVLKIYIDGVEVVANGNYRGSKVEIIEEHETVDVRYIPIALPFAVANAPTWLKQKTRFMYNEGSILYVDSVVDFLRTQHMKHYGLIQTQPITIGIDSTITKKVYMPNSGIFGGVDYRVPVTMNTTPSGNVDVIFNVSNVEDVNKPVQRYIELLNDSANTSKIAMAHGYLYQKGITGNINRRSFTDQWEIRGSSGKSYPKGLNDYFTTNQVVNMLGYFNYYDPSLNPNATAVYVNKEGSDYVLYIDYHQAIVKDKITLPSYVKGKTIIQIDGNGGLVINSGDQVAGSFLNITTTLINGYAYGVYKLI